MNLSDLAIDIHAANEARGWWDRGCGPEVVATKLLLIITEIAEATEAYRTGAMDTHLPKHPGITVELADAMIRILDLAGALGLDIEEAVREKLAYNAIRADHDPKTRRKEF